MEMAITDYISHVDTIFFRLTLAHKFPIDTSNVTICLETLFVEKRGFNANKCGVT